MRHEIKRLSQATNPARRFFKDVEAFGSSRNTGYGIVILDQDLDERVIRDVLYRRSIARPHLRRVIIIRGEAVVIHEAPFEP